MDMELKNDHNVYILGAGFSREAGLPLISDFLTRMRDSHPGLVTKGRKKEADAVNSVLEFRRQAESAAYWTNLDLENIEDLFSLASASATNISRDIQLAIAATLDFCAESAGNSRAPLHIQYVPAEKIAWTRDAPWLLNKQPVNQFEINRYTYFVAKLLGMFQNGQVKGENTFITFNYDTVLEDALFELGVRFSYGFEKHIDDLEASAKVSHEDGALIVLKLHGSVNWAKRDETPGRSFVVHGNFSDVQKAGLIPELVPPTWKKAFNGQLGEAWASAVRKLQTATRVVAIGFSMPPTDMHFKYLIAAGVQQNVSLRQIVFFNPAAAELKACAQMLFRASYIESGKVVFQNSTLGELAANHKLLTDLGRPVYPGASIRYSGCESLLP